MKTLLKRWARRLVPLGLRKRLAIAVNRCRWLPARRRSWWAGELVRDLADRNIEEYHKFLWRHHLDYASPYEVELRFGEDQMRGSRKLFFDELQRQLGVRRGTIRTVYEVGCSCGYQLRHLENHLFPQATELAGSDIDRHAVEQGRAYLHRVGSKVALEVADMEELEEVFGSGSYDLMICAGVLMYLPEARAVRVVRSMLAHTRVMLAFAGLAHPDRDNLELESSAVREDDNSFVHNIDRIVTDAGGTVVGRSWQGSRFVDGQSVYFVFAEPEGNQELSRA